MHTKKDPNYVFYPYETVNLKHMYLYEIFLKVGRGCPEAAVLYCSFNVVRFILNTFVKKNRIENVGKKLLREIAFDRADCDQVLELMNKIL